MNDRLGRSSRAGLTMLTWPRLLDIHLAAAYLSVGEQSVRDYIADGILTPVKLPGAKIRGENKTVIARPRQRTMNKLLIDREDCDKLIERLKAEQGAR